ncbi:MAG: leucine-rich repeat protein, partial [Clostridia bacterium]|nr:leucine-rich repeat protein [Clostridia bacterium]
EVIESETFLGCNSLKKIIIPDGISTIGMSAFENCTALVEISVPDTLTTVERYAFSNTGFRKVSSNLENGCFYVDNILVECFSDVSDCIIREGTTVIASCAFYRLTAIKKIAIPDTVRTIGNSAFYYCENLENITFGKGLETIGTDAFGNCNKIVSINYTGNMSDWFFIDFQSYPISIYNNETISFCVKGENVTEVIIPEGVKNIPSFALHNCLSLTDLSIPSSVENFGYNAFSGCSNLSKVIMADGLRLIGESAFTNCHSLNAVEIPDSVIYIGGYAFHYTGCYKNASNWDSGVLYIGNHLVAIDNFKEDFYYIKEGTKSIAVGTFRNSNSLKLVAIPNGIQIIAENTFNNCDNLEEVIIGNGTEKILDYAFYSCDKLKTVNIGKGLKSVNYNSFLNSSNLKIVRYAGSEDEWKLIDNSNAQLKTATKEYNYIISYDLILDSNGGEFADGAYIFTDTVYYGRELSGIIPEDPTKEGCVFCGWVDENGNYVENLPSTMPAYDLTLTAVWEGKKFFVEFYDGEEWLCGSNQTYGEPIVVEYDHPVKEGFEFTGWVDSEGNPMPETVPAHDAAYYATYAIIEHRVTYDANGGGFANTDGSTSSFVEFYNVAYGAEIPVPQSNPVRDGYTFIRWSPVVPDAMPDADLVFTAEWEAIPEPEAVEYEIYVSYPNPANPEEIIEKLVITDSAFPGTTVDIIKSDEASYADYHTYDEIIANLGVGYIEPDYDNRPAPMTVTENGGKIVVPFKLTEYTVEFSPNGGKFGTSEESVTVTGIWGQMIEIPADPTRTGYTFAGWDREVPEVFTENLVFKATWELQRHDAIFIVVDEHGDEVVRFICGYNYEEIITAPEFDAPAGYEFNGWGIPEGMIMGEEDITFTSYLEPLVYTFVFNAGDGSFSDGETTKTYTYRYGYTVTAPEIPEATGKRFVDWDNDIPEFAETDMTFEAIYEDELYTVTFKADNNSDGIYETLAGTRTFVYGEQLTIFAVPDNYPTDGWTLEDGSPVTFSYGYDAYTVTGDVTFYITQKTEYYASNVKTYAELDAEYDKFVYVGIDVVEVANGQLTDGYVQPGDWLEYHMTVLSDMYVGTSYPCIVYEKNFFDVRIITSMNKPDHDNYENTDYEGNLKFTDGTLMNPDHPYAAPNVATYHTLTALPATKITNQMEYCEIDAETYSNWDIVKSNVGITTT